ncbi:type II toxin-antitoxin system RelE/ParE family toxin [Thalassotalea sp. ND16A]|uniref:type II toxin-antitoxin system RelE/ParE family toxin n=1 Tax=Thalassotalea sp. ND16A TaxID=1535422 RepID=UPI00051A2F2A|nr:type II toxin-antitoxin system RelE/ParE family toxin [Thalassotalea sp. ND16A]KGJ97176.1 hypothetical protein ND16A_0098 [Thalassotalea sp. ND16A]
MKALTLLISPQAQEDLILIYAYSQLNFKKSIADNYLDLIHQRILKLSQSPKIGSTKNHILPGLRAVNAERHLIYYRISQNNIEIIRILHHKQEPFKNLSK